VQYDPEAGTYWLNEEQAFALTNPDGPVFAPGAFQLAVAALRAEPEIAEAFLCVPNALSQEGGYSLGAQAGEELIRRIATDAGFGRFRRVAETPFNIVYEPRR
jgi:hypothetical protein